MFILRPFLHEGYAHIFSIRPSKVKNFGKYTFELCYLLKPLHNQYGGGRVITVINNFYLCTGACW